MRAGTSGNMVDHDLNFGLIFGGQVRSFHWPQETFSMLPDGTDNARNCGKDNGDHLRKWYEGAGRECSGDGNHPTSLRTININH